MALEAFLATSPIFTLIMYSHPIRQEDLAVIEAYGKQHKTPLVAIHSAGFYSYFRISLPGAFPIVDTHPDETATTDLRLLNPWPELTDFARELTENIDSLDNHLHGHLPFIAILLHYLGLWKESHDGQYPSSYAEKTAFRRLVQEGARRDNPEGGEENFDEAVAAVLKTIVPCSLPSSLKEVFDHPHMSPVCLPAHSPLSAAPYPRKSGAQLTRIIRRSKSRGSGSSQMLSSSSSSSTSAYRFLGACQI